MLAGRVALVTGGSRGIGWATAELFAEHGAHVVINGRSDPSARAKELSERFGVETLAIAADVAKAAEVDAMFREIFKKWKRLDVLVNNAGILEDALVGMIPDAMIDGVIDVNTKGAIRCLQGAARLMTRAKRGSIINMTSIVGTNGNEGQAVYGASKAALIGLTKSAAKELAPQGIRVNAIAPGYIDTDMVRALPADKQAKLVAAIGMGRAGTAKDVAKVALFLASDLAEYVTGQVVGVDGGLRM
ncbi:MAG TPA: SDR family oxidoreductase [Kofleriaceae bacterium]|nr:SDR family oxidoreductase [Kofleriaceae bacterium]